MPKVLEETKKKIVSPLPVAEETKKGLAKRAEGGDREALVELRSRIARGTEWNSPFGNPAAQAEGVLVKQLSNQAEEKDRYEKELHIRHKLKMMKEELLGADPSPLEQVLVDRVVLCWLQVNHATMYETASIMTNHADIAQFHSKRQERAHKMFLSAVKALAQVRRLQVPSVQVNIAEKQINVGG